MQAAAAPTAPGDADKLDRATVMALVALALAIFVIANDFTALSVALPSMEKDFDAVKPGSLSTIFAFAAYFAADMFIQAVKTAMKKAGKNLTPEAVQQALANQSWEIKGLVGPTKYPASTVVATLACGELISSNGTSWDVVVPYACSAKRIATSS